MNINIIPFIIFVKKVRRGNPSKIMNIIDINKRIIEKYFRAIFSETCKR